MKFHTTIAQSSTPDPKPLTVGSLQDATGWTLLIAAIIWIGKQAWELFSHKEKSESELTKTLIDDLRADRQNLIENNREGFKEVVEAINAQTVRTTEELRAHDSLIARFSQSLHTDVQSTLKSQSAIYAATNNELVEIKQLLKSLHRRMDELIDSRKGKENRHHDDLG